MAALLLPSTPSSPLPLFPSTATPRRLSTITPHLSRWNNANAQPSIAPLRRQQDIEADIRLHRRHQSASSLLLCSSPQKNINQQREQRERQAEFVKSKGTPSAPSAPSIPGKKSKYSKPPPAPKGTNFIHHPAFRPRRPPLLPVPSSEDGVSFKLEGAPFAFQYSYTETPKAKPLALRAPLFTPFGPETMPRPWTGRAPLPKSQKKLPEFDSFLPPPPGKKGVKSVQAPGPFVEGSGPRYAVSREAVLGEPLTEEEVKVLVQGCMKANRQLNMGRDGLTHNMLDNIHAHWKRRRVCKIKCKGVCTVDLNNVRQQLEEKSGGKVIYSRGGVIFLFRGRNYNYKTRPKFPLMLWKPTPPVYPRLVQHAPEGLTLEEATVMRKKGHGLLPICKLAKNGVYHNLVKDVQEAFEECELVRIDCKSLNRNDVRKIGAKLMDLVPCVLMSFAYEHILMWRGKDWKSTLTPQMEHVAEELVSDVPLHSQSVDSLGDNPVFTDLDKILDSEIQCGGNGSCTENEDDIGPYDESDNESDFNVDSDDPSMAFGAFDLVDDDDVIDQATECSDEKELLDDDTRNHSIVDRAVNGAGYLDRREHLSGSEVTFSANEDSTIRVCPSDERRSSVSKIEESSSDLEAKTTPDYWQIENHRPHFWIDHVRTLLKQAIETGCAVVLDADSLDANLVYQRTVDLARTAPTGPVFRHENKKSGRKIQETNYKKAEKDGNQDQDQDLRFASTEVSKGTNRKGVKKPSKKSKISDSFPSVTPHGSLKIDELARLLA